MEIKMPKHIAVVMDGNGRWAKQRSLPRTAGHKAGVASVRRTIQAVSEQGVKVLTLYAFSSENWRRPAEEVSFLMRLFYTLLTREINKIHKNNIQLRIIGDYSILNPKLVSKIDLAQSLTQANTGLVLQLALNYGAQAEIVQACKQIAVKIAAGQLDATAINKHLFSQHLDFPDLPPPDLLIRTGGELRVSNFLLWHLAYTELYFTNKFWPDFSELDLDLAIKDYSSRQRRFGFTGDQAEEELYA